MPRYEQEVIEMRTYKVFYVVEAKDEDEAQDKISIGDTLSEKESGTCEVLNREPYGPLVKLKKKK